MRYTSIGDRAHSLVDRHLQALMRGLLAEQPCCVVFFGKVDHENFGAGERLLTRRIDRCQSPGGSVCPGLPPLERMSVGLHHWRRSALLSSPSGGAGLLPQFSEGPGAHFLGGREQDEGAYPQKNNSSKH